MSKDYRKSDYGINKYSEGIVYRYADGHSITITFEMIAAVNPTFTQDDFDKIKAFSDDFYHREAKAECNQSCSITAYGYISIDKPVFDTPRLPMRAESLKGWLLLLFSQRELLTE